MLRPRTWITAGIALTTAGAALMGTGLALQGAAAPPDYTGPVFAAGAPGQCLDVAGAFGAGVSGLRLQTWACGALRYADQVFHVNGTLGLLEYVGRNGVTECVVQSGAAPYDQLVLGSCPASPDVILTGAPGGVTVRFANGEVMDVKGQGAASGTPVGTFGPNGGANQLWHLLQNPGVPAG